jgi:hypothetical protein
MNLFPRFTAISALFIAGVASVPAAAQDYPEIPEPMVFDMVRSLGAKAGEFEINTLARVNLSGPHQSLEWAPEIEATVADGLALEFELPMQGGKVMEYKLGVQGTIGTFADGKGAHGVQYLGIYDRETGRWENALLYINGYRFSEKLSAVGMVGVGGIGFNRTDEAKLLLNQAVFYETSERGRIGLEVNYKSGHDGDVLIMPQLHQAIGKKLSVQAGLGATHKKGEHWHPQAGLRLIATM